jgi:hypothetical protein
MGAVQIPNSIVKFNGLEKDLSTTVATALWKKVAGVQEYLNASVPIGKIIWFRAIQDLLPEMPDPKYWKELDGTVVSNVNSPFNGWTTPNLAGYFLKHPSGVEANQAASGSDTRNLGHNHGGHDIDRRKLRQQRSRRQRREAGTVLPRPHDRYLVEHPRHQAAVPRPALFHEDRLMTTDLDDDLGTAGALVSVEAFSGLSDNCNQFIDSVGVGEICAVIVLDGLTPEPDPSIWALCEGGTVSDERSPLRGQAIPDMRDRYLKGASSPATSGITGGANSYDLTHNHTGFTQVTDSGPRDVDRIEIGSRYNEGAPHRHSLPSALSAVSFEPKHFTVKHYLKIR